MATPSAPRTRRLGDSGLEVGPLVFGGNVFGWTVDEPAAMSLLDAFVEAGFNLIDTANVYSRWVPGNQGGESETIIGKWLKRSGKRSQVLIATKVGMEMTPEEKGLSRPSIFRAVEQSLRRLQTDCIDLYQTHRDDETTPIEETLEALGELMKQGKVRAIGASNYKAERLARALELSGSGGLPRFQSLQPLYNLYDRAPFEEALEPLCLRERLGVIPYFSLASGFLTGKYRAEEDLSKSPRGERVKKYLDARGRRILEALDLVAARLESTPARVALAWLLARPSVTAPIASATSLAQLADLVEATRLKLDPTAIGLLDTAGAANPVPS